MDRFGKNINCIYKHDIRIISFLKIETIKLIEK